MSTPRLFAIPLGQGPWVSGVCWTSCGKGLIGGIDLGPGGAAIPCATPASECPHFVKEQDGEPFATIDDGDDPARPIWLRAISEKPREFTTPEAP
ncbi:MAG TPA: hypothetical protein PK948_05030 [Gemmatimonadales bacterium]|nr:hypothetical protein [Gemmatimonadales bacterium]